MRFDLTDLRLFLHIAESGSITAGAELAHLALASASARIRGMEDMLGVPLLRRGRRGVETTDAGRTLLHHARVITQQMEKMRADLGDHASGLKGHIRVLCNTSALAEFLPDALAGFMAAHPQVNIDLEERLSYDIVQAMRDGLADIGVIADSVDSGGLELYPFRDDRLVLAMAPGHPLAARLKRKRSCAFADALGHDFIGLAGDSALQKYISGQAARLGERLTYRVRLRSLDAVCRMAASGAGLAVLPESAVLRSRDVMRIRHVQLTDAWAVRKLLICVRRYADLPGYARELVDTLQPSN
ncbi:LysR substrate-binding domain-containing protein [Pseudoduganella namucuonensis]|uniref:ModE molybdate transport repressor domain-containing protein n=1 Tax=Pseudoduganella namucuonensis TaxID=1035707 RepID=A0A1I7F575_9BURK|nr:LysR substrate-binding domain-containing protein [Pseudoduganella namucuonensis]SFU31306.1 ModE molybdate transport repressor domain-containing protein [Pseudoduganella namucuonensis]